METQTVNVIVCPPNETNERVIELAEILRQKYEMDFSLVDRKKTVHISIRQMHIPKENYGKLNSKLQEILEDFKPFQLSLGHYKTYGGVYASWMCEPNETLLKLHAEIMGKTNSLRNGLRLLNYSPDATESVFGGQKYSPEQTANILQYGWGACLELYEPHVTFAKTKDPVDSQTFAELLPQYKSSFEVGEICIGRMEHTTIGNQFGYVSGILDRIPLKK